MIHRAPQLSVAEFEDYWARVHSRMAVSTAPMLRMRRYVQNRRREHEIAGLFQQSRGCIMGGFDGVAEAWWDSFADMAAAAGETPEAIAAAILQDEARFVDLARSVIWFGDEKVFWPQSAPTESVMNETLMLRLAVEDFIFREAALLDAWKLKDWLALFAAETRYEVAPTGDSEAAELSSAESLFLVADDRERLEQRVLRLGKPQAHAEYPYSRTRHLYSNLRILSHDASQVSATSNFVTFRTKRSITATYMGLHFWLLERCGPDFLIRQKRVVLDLDGLVPQGKVSLLL